MKRHDTLTRPEFFTVDVSAIVCDTPAVAFGAEQIAAGAALIAAAGGLATPIVLTKGDFDPSLGDYRYHVVHGALAYHAAVAYRAEHPRAGEYVNAMVVDTATARTAAAQAALFA